MSRPIARPRAPMKAVISLFHHQTLQQLVENARKQTVFPEEIYPGFRKVNEERRRKAKDDHSKGWFSTGEGMKSFQGRIVENDGEGNITLEYQFREYLRFVEIGVGAGTKKEDVERSRPVKWDKRYISKWARPVGHSHRASILPTIAREETRLGNYLRDFFGWDYIETIASIDDQAIEKVMNQT